MDRDDIKLKFAEHDGRIRALEKGRDAILTAATHVHESLREMKQIRDEHKAELQGAIDGARRTFEHAIEAHVQRGVGLSIGPANAAQTSTLKKEIRRAWVPMVVALIAALGTGVGGYFEFRAQATEMRELQETLARTLEKRP